ncbi:MAG TPA: Wzt carbohydrate-binding domain-containing protein, partial [Bacteroidia bacterium]|nr:Wzt carbohydrate-binding domain-containing protein [Bacteroidia bacterium]
FNPLLSGRENVYNNGQLLGFSKKEVEERFNAILEFAEIGKFIDSPVQNYSSGMKVRLGFAIAAQMEPDILLIDEVLAVGDMGFVLKCFNKMDVLRSKTAMIFVTHGLSQVSRMCTDISILNEGKSVYQSSNVAAGITRYYEMFKTQIVSFKASDKVSIEKITLSSEGKESTDEKTLTVEHGAELCLSLELNCIKPVYNPRIALIFYDKEQKNIAETLNFDQQIVLPEVEGLLSIKAVLPQVIFSQGNYSITIALSEIENGSRKIVFRQQSAIYFNVHSKVHGWAPVQLDFNWELVSGNVNTP